MDGSAKSTSADSTISIAIATSDPSTASSSSGTLLVDKDGLVNSFDSESGSVDAARLESADTSASAKVSALLPRQYHVLRSFLRRALAKMRMKSSSPQVGGKSAGVNAPASSSCSAALPAEKHPSTPAGKLAVPCPGGSVIAEASSSASILPGEKNRKRQKPVASASNDYDGGGVGEDPIAGPSPPKQRRLEYGDVKPDVSGDISEARGTNDAGATVDPAKESCAEENLRAVFHRLLATRPTSRQCESKNCKEPLMQDPPTDFIDKLQRGAELLGIKYRAPMDYMLTEGYPAGNMSSAIPLTLEEWRAHKEQEHEERTKQSRAAKEQYSPAPDFYGSIDIPLYVQRDGHRLDKKAFINRRSGEFFDNSLVDVLRPMEAAALPCGHIICYLCLRKDRPATCPVMIQQPAAKSEAGASEDGVELPQTCWSPCGVPCTEVVRWQYRWSVECGQEGGIWRALRVNVVDDVKAEQAKVAERFKFVR